MAYLGISTKDHTCAICKKLVPSCSLVYHDPLKKPGFHIVHQQCWERLCEKRGTTLVDHPKNPPILSPENLDPPF